MHELKLCIKHLVHFIRVFLYTALGMLSQSEQFTGDMLILLYKGLNGKARIPTVDLIHQNRHCRNHHSMAFQIPSASKDAYKKSCFPQTIRDWNDLPDSLISSAELSDDCVC